MNEEKRIVLPGDLVAQGAQRLDGCFVEKGNTYAAIVGMQTGDKIVPLKGFYTPRHGDFVIGIVKEVRFSGYEVEINSPYYGNMSSKELRDEYRVGEVVSAKIFSVNEVNDAELVDPRRMTGGEIMEVEHVKIPRVIGKNASMLGMIADYTRSDIQVGKNGRIYLRDGDTALASLAILKICREAHTSGLTERVKEMLEKQAKQPPKQRAPEGEAQADPEAGADGSWSVRPSQQKEVE
jgi:exosome complex component RRP4